MLRSWLFNLKKFSRQSLVLTALLFISLNGMAESVNTTAADRSATQAASSSVGTLGVNSAPAAVAGQKGSSARASQSGRTRARGRASYRQTRTHGVGHYRPHHTYYYGYYGYPFFSGSFYWGWPYYGWYGPYWYGYPRYYGPPNYDYRAGAIDLNVKPKKTKVYLNGKYIGKATEFDGWPGYLVLREGTYELIFFLDGHKTERREFKVEAGTVLRTRFELQPGDSTPPEAISNPPKVRDRGTEDERFSPPPPRERYNRDSGANSVDLNEGGYDLRGEPARLDFSIVPDDASVYLDGKFLGTGRELNRLKKPLLVDDGNHLVEVVRPGYRGKTLTVEVAKGGTETIKVDLSDQKE